MRIPAIFGATVIGLAGVGAIAAPPVQALKLSSGEVFFEQVPRLVDAYANFRTTQVRNTKHYFTINVPENAGEPLGKVEIQQTRNEQKLKYEADGSEAFVGAYRRKGESLGISTVSQNSDTGAVTVTFAEPVAPGQTITVGIKAKRNPDFSGIYQFGVKAFPDGEKARGQFLGLGRINFFGSDASS